MSFEYEEDLAKVAEPYIDDDDDAEYYDDEDDDGAEYYDEDEDEYAGLDDLYGNIVGSDEKTAKDSAVEEVNSFLGRISVAATSTVSSVLPSKPSSNGKSEQKPESAPSTNEKTEKQSNLADARTQSNGSNNNQRDTQHDKRLRTTEAEWVTSDEPEEQQTQLDNQIVVQQERRHCCC